MLTVQIIDDGTLDTVIKINDRVYRYNFDYNIDNDSEPQSYEDFVNWAMNDAKEMYLEEIEIEKEATKWNLHH